MLSGTDPLREGCVQWVARSVACLLPKKGEKGAGAPAAGAGAHAVGVFSPLIMLGVFTSSCDFLYLLNLQVPIGGW